jgi:transmembrane sensor
MRNPFTIRRRAREEALAWLARMKRGLRPAEGPQLIAWLRRRSHRRLIAKAAAEWHGPEVLAVLSQIFPIDPASLEPRRGRHPATAVAIFACIMVLPTGFFLLLHALGLGRHLDGWYTTTPNAIQRLSLEDGTRVALNRGTGINVLFMEHIRSVLVARGEAIFEVANSPYRPFSVHAAGRVFETDSATFDIRIAAPDRLTLTVLAGTVTAFPAQRSQRDDGPEREIDPLMYKSVLIQPLQMLTIEPDEEFGQALTEKDVRSRLSWQGGT